MPTYFRRDDFVVNGLGYSIPNTTVTYYTQPSLTLAAIYSGPSGGSIPNPQFTDGIGHTFAYMLPGLYTIVYSGPQLQTETLPDQNIGGGGGGSTVTVFQGIPTGTIDGVNRVFTFSVPVTPSQLTVWLNFPLIVNAGYTTSWASGTVTIVYTVAPQIGDDLYVQGFYET